MEIKINKEIRDYTETIFFGLSSNCGNLIKPNPNFFMFTLPINKNH